MHCGGFTRMLDPTKARRTYLQNPKQGPAEAALRRPGLRCHSTRLAGETRRRTPGVPFLLYRVPLKLSYRASFMRDPTKRIYKGLGVYWDFLKVLENNSPWGQLERNIEAGYEYKD